MKLDKLTVLKILGIAGAAIFFYWALQNLSVLAGAAGWLLNILWPLILGFCTAFVLNIPMRFFERHLLKNPKSKRVAALRRAPSSGSRASARTRQRNSAASASASSRCVQLSVMRNSSVG